MNDLVDPVWLREQIDEDERVARAAGGEVWSDEGLAADPVPTVGTVGYLHQNYHLDREYWQHIALHDPARALREVETKRALLDEYDAAFDRRKRHPGDLATSGALLAMVGVIRRLAQVYVNRPGYREEWRPSEDEQRG